MLVTLRHLLLCCFSMLQMQRILPHPLRPPECLLPDGQVQGEGGGGENAPAPRGPSHPSLALKSSPARGTPSLLRSMSGSLSSEPTYLSFLLFLPPPHHLKKNTTAMDGASPWKQVRDGGSNRIKCLLSLPVATPSCSPLHFIPCPSATDGVGGGGGRPFLPKLWLGISSQFCTVWVLPGHPSLPLKMGLVLLRCTPNSASCTPSDLLLGATFVSSYLFGP